MRHRAEDALLADYCYFDGRKGSLDRLWKMRDCGVYARVLNAAWDDFSCGVWQTKSRTMVSVEIEFPDTHVERYSVMRTYPFSGLQPLYNRLRELALPMMKV